MGFLQRMAYRGMFGRAAAILPLDMRSGHAVGETSPQSHDKIRVMPNFIVCSSVPSKLSSDGSSGPLKIVFVGTLIREKNIHVLLELARRVDGISLTLVGHSSPQMVAEINELIQRDGLHDRLHLAGEMPNDEVRKFIAGQDVCILPSFTEGFPMSVLEAMAIGLPIVASPAGALPDMIDVPEGGFLVEPDDIEGFVEAMIKLRDDRPTAVAMGSYNRERALRDYDYDVVARQLVDLYSGLAERTDIRQGSGR
jgi:glycosyltransferase involved in cell wall biosynthesis